MHRVDRRIVRVGAGLAPLVIAIGWLIGWSLAPGHRAFVPPAYTATSPLATSSARTFETGEPAPVRTAPRPKPAAAPSLPAPPAPPAATTTAAAPTSPAPVATTPPSTPTSSTPTATPTQEAPVHG